jgi:transcriptional regulator with XRE-family HTH domain
MNYREEIGSELQTLRVQRGLTVRELAEASGVHYSNIAKIENGRYNVSVDILGKVAEALGCKLTFEPREEDKRVLVRKLKEHKTQVDKLRELNEKWKKGVTVKF